jgi:PAS domain S-box-containing protein
MNQENMNPQSFPLSEAMYYSIFENTGTATVIIEQDTTIYLANREFSRLSGFAKDEVEGRKSWKDFVAFPQDLSRMEKIHYHRQTYPQSVPERYEFVLRDKKDQLRHVSVTGGSIPGTNRNIVSLTDITELKQKEHYLLESKEFSYTLLDNSPNPIFVVNPDSSIEYVNPALEEMVGYSLAELKGVKAPYPWWTEVTLPHNYEDFKEILQNGINKREEVFQNRKGERLYVELTGTSVRDKDGGLKYYISNWNDISGHKQREEALEKSENKFRFLAENSADIIWSLDRNLVFTYISPAVEKILGYSQDQIMGMPLEAILSPDSYTLVMQVYEQIISGEAESNVMSFQVEHIHKDGSIIWGDVHVTLLLDQERQAVGAQGVTRDITAQKKAEQALKQSEERYRTLVEHQMEAVCRWQPDTTLTFVNEGYCRFYDKTRQELIGNKFLYFFDQEQQALFLDYVDSLMKEPRIDIREQKMKTADGRDFWQEWINSPIFDEQGHVVEFQGIGRDITKRKKIEEQLWIRTHALESSINGIVLADLSGEITYVNPSFLRMTQYTDINQVLGTYFGQYFDNRELSSTIIKALHQNEFWRGELLLQRHVNTPIQIELVANWVKNLKGEPLCFMASFIDISARKEAEHRLKKAYNEMEKIVNKRTRELKNTNESLYREISEHLESEKALQEKSEEQELLLNNIDTQIWYLSDPQTYRLANKARADFLGKDQSFFRDKNLFEIMPTKDAEICYANNKWAYKEKKTFKLEDWYSDKNGDRRLLSVTRTPQLDARGQVKYLICVANDITESRMVRKEIEKNRAQLKRSQMVAQVATWEIDYQTGEIFFSDEQCRLFGYNPKEISLDMEVIKKHIHSEDLASMTDMFSGNKNLLKPFDIKCRFYTRDGQERIGQWIAEADQDRQGNVLRVYGTMQDITDQMRMEHELYKTRESYRQLLLSSQQKRQFHNIIGKNEQMQKIYVLIQQLADVDSTVLITGESGTGKELVVEALHYTGHRSKGPLIKVNSSALSEGLLDSELFGHVRGAFTGAEKDKIGRIEAAEGGTLFLDEIGDISAVIQLKLLRFLEEREFERVGDSKTLKSDVRIVAATNIDLYQKVHQGIFRKDLYFRLNVINLYVPPLHQRRDDIPLLVDHFVRHFSKIFNKNISGISKEVMGVFMNHSWPGNVRELKHAIEHACILCQSGEIETEHLPKDFFEISKVDYEAFDSNSKRKISKEKIVEALELTKGNKIEAAKILGISRRTLYRKMHFYKMVKER